MTLSSPLAIFHPIVLASVDHSWLNQWLHWGLQNDYVSKYHYDNISYLANLFSFLFPFSLFFLSLLFSVLPLVRLIIISDALVLLTLTSVSPLIWFLKPCDTIPLAFEHFLPFWNNMSRLTFCFSCLRHGLRHFPQSALVPFTGECFCIVFSFWRQCMSF